MSDAQADLDGLAARVRKEISSFDYSSYVSERANSLGVGTPLSREFFQDALTSMERSLVRPYPINIRVRKGMISDVDAKSEVERCVVVADDSEGRLVAYVPSMREFSIARKLSSGDLATYGINGSALDCFISR